MLRLLKVTGNSMQPFYRDGDFVLVSKVPFNIRGVRPGDVVVFRQRAYGIMIKKVERVSPAQDEISVYGTHTMSVDSRNFGPLHPDEVLGKVIWHIKRPER